MMMKPSPCPVCGFVRRPARGLPLGDCGGMRSPCSAHVVGRQYQVLEDVKIHNGKFALCGEV